jgi:excisionase family DNA binding protein
VTSDQEELLSTGQAAKLAGVHRATIDRWIKLGMLPVARRLPSGHARVRKGEVMKLVEEKDELG